MTTSAYARPAANFVCKDCGADQHPTLVTGYCRQCGSFERLVNKAAPALSGIGPCVLAVTFAAGTNPAHRTYIRSFNAQKIVYTDSKRFAYKFASAEDCKGSWVYRFFQGDQPQIELAL